MPMAKPNTSVGEAIDLDGSPYDGLWVQALMYAPGDVAFRRGFFAANYVRINELDLPGPPVTIDRDVLAGLLDAPRWEDLGAEVRQRARDAMVTGQILVALFLMHRYPELLGARGLGGISLNKAFHYLQYIGRDLRWAYGDGTLFPTGETKIKECWATYRRVAHLWAAHAWMTTIPIFDPQTMFREKLGLFLSAARYFETFGCERILDHKGAKSKSAILVNDHWRVPDKYPAKLHVPKDASWFHESPLVQALKTYAAK